MCSAIWKRHVADKGSLPGCKRAPPASSPEAVSVQLISERYANFEGHFLMDMRHISVRVFPDLK